MVLPIDFKLHEVRLSREVLDAIEFQFERFAQDSTNIEKFLERFLRISKSPTMPPDEIEIFYLTSKVAYMIADYDHFSEFYDKIQLNDGAKIWFALTKAAHGEIDDAISILKDILPKIDSNTDPMLYLECLGILAQILFIHGSNKNGSLTSIVEKINSFRENHSETLDDFNQLFLPCYLILERIQSEELSTEANLENLISVYDIVQKTQNNYFTLQVQLDLCYAYMKNNNLGKAKELIDEAFKKLKVLKYKALEAKAQQFMGQWLEANDDFIEAEKVYSHAKSLYAQLKDQIGIANCVILLACLAERQDQFKKAEAFYQESFELSKKTSNSYGESVSLVALARFEADKGQFLTSLKFYQRALHLVNDNHFYQLLPSIYDGLTYSNFIAGDFVTAIECKRNALKNKMNFKYNKEEILLQHIQLGQLIAICGEFNVAFNEFEKALVLCAKMDKKGENYFTILNWLFELSCALDQKDLAESYFTRVELFASIHNSEKENAQATLSRIRFFRQKNEFEEAEKVLESIINLARDFSSGLIMALAIIEKAIIQLTKFLDNSESLMIEEILQTIDDMLLISLDLEFLPLTLQTKKVLGKILIFNEDYSEGIDELTEAIELVNEFGLKKYQKMLQVDIKKLESLYNKANTLTALKLSKIKKESLCDALDCLHMTFWLTSALEYQRKRMI